MADKKKGPIVHLPPNQKLISVQKGSNVFNYKCLTRLRRKDEKPEKYELGEFSINTISGVDDFGDLEAIFQEH